MRIEEAIAWAERNPGSIADMLATEVRRLRNERDAALNLLEGYAPDLTQRLRDQMAFDREEGR